MTHAGLDESNLPKIGDLEILSVQAGHLNQGQANMDAKDTIVEWPAISAICKEQPGSPLTHRWEQINPRLRENDIRRVFSWFLKVFKFLALFFLHRLD